MATGTGAAPRVLVITVAFGAGDAKAASAIAQELTRQAPRAEVLVVDALAGSRWLFRALYVWPYWLMVRYAPRLWRRLFSTRVRNVHRRTAPRWAFRFGCPAAFRALADFQPDVVVAAEGAAFEVPLEAGPRGPC